MIGVKFIHAAYYSLAALHVCIDVNGADDLIIYRVYYQAIDGEILLNHAAEPLKLHLS